MKIEPGQPSTPPPVDPDKPHPPEEGKDFDSVMDQVEEQEQHTQQVNQQAQAKPKSSNKYNSNKVEVRQERQPKSEGQSELHPGQEKGKGFMKNPTIQKAGQQNVSVNQESSQTATELPKDAKSFTPFLEGKSATLEQTREKLLDQTAAEGQKSGTSSPQKTLKDFSGHPSHEGKPEAAVGQMLPLSSYLEPAQQVSNVQQASHAGLPISEIEKIVDRVLVGVNESGDPQIKVDLHLPHLGPVDIQVTRGEGGLVIQLNTQTQHAGEQLGQNLQALQATLAERGLQVNNIQLMVQNQAIPMNEMIHAERPVGDSRSDRKDSGRTIRDKKAERPPSPPKKGH